jgi:hypothetical protein
MIKVQFTGHGSVWLVRPLTPEANSWIADNIPADAQWWGSAVMIDACHVYDVVQHMINDGLLPSAFKLAHAGDPSCHT